MTTEHFDLLVVIKRTEYPGLVVNSALSSAFFAGQPTVSLTPQATLLGFSGGEVGSPAVTAQPPGILSFEFNASPIVDSISNFALLQGTAPVGNLANGKINTSTGNFFASFSDAPISGVSSSLSITPTLVLPLQADVNSGVLGVYLEFSNGKYLDCTFSAEAGTAVNSVETGTVGGAVDSFESITLDSVISPGSYLISLDLTGTAASWRVNGLSSTVSWNAAPVGSVPISLSFSSISKFQIYVPADAQPGQPFLEMDSLVVSWT